MEFTWQYLATIAGATAAVVLITNAITLATGFSARWLALAVAAVVELAVWAILSRTAEAFGLAVVNTFVVYLAAGGANQIIVAARVKPDALEMAPEHPDARRSFWAPWWKSD